jgi:hypothetical protein
MTTAPRWVRNLGDTAPALDYVLRLAPTPGQRYGTPYNVSGADSVIGNVRRWSDRAVVASAAATVVDAANGVVAVPLTTMIATSPGLHAVEVVAIDGAEQRTFPTSPLQPEWLLIGQPLGGGTTVPLLDAGAPLFVADGGAVSVTTNGQIVFAGASATVTLPTSVSWIQLAAWDAQTAWASGTTPTLVQAGSTVSGAMAAALLASGGNLVVVTRAGTVLTPAATGRATIWAYNGASYAPDPDARLIERATGEPAPTGVGANDIVLTEN